MSYNKLIDALKKETGKTEREIIEQYGIDKGKSKMQKEREKIGMFRTELARRTGISKNTIVKYEERNGLNGASCKNGLLISKALGKPLEELLDNFEWPETLI